MVHTLSPGGPGGPSFPELPWKDQIRSKWWTCTSLYVKTWQWSIVQTFGPAFPVGPLGPLSPRGPLRKENVIKVIESIQRDICDGKMLSVIIVSVWNPLRQVVAPLSLRCQARHLCIGTSMLSKTYRWSSLSAWARLSCCSLWTRRTHRMIKGVGRFIKRLHPVEEGTSCQETLITASTFKLWDDIYH